MKKLLIILILLILPLNVQASKYKILIELTDKEGVLLLTDRLGTREVPNQFETDDIVFYSFPYSTGHSLAEAQIEIIPQDLMMNVCVTVKQEYHNENWYYSVQNGNAYLASRLLKMNEFYLPLQTENSIDFSGWLQSGDYTMFRLDLYNVVNVRLK